MCLFSENKNGEALGCRILYVHFQIHFKEWEVTATKFENERCKSAKANSQPSKLSNGPSTVSEKFAILEQNLLDL
jgi:hypothetical protein